MARLGDYVTIKTGKLDANASSDNGIYPFFTCSKDPLKIDTYSYDCECVLVAGNGDLNVKYYRGKFDAYQRTYIIESKNKEKLSVRFLFYFLDKYVDTLREQSIGGVIKYIKLGNLTEANIPLPPLEEQHKIAAVLDKVSDLIAKRHEQLDKLDLLVKSQFIEMFGNPIENPMKWPVHHLSEHINFLTSGSRGWAKYFTEDGEYFITIKNVKGCRISLENMQHIVPPDNAEAKRTKVQSGDLLISITADLGRTGVVSEEIAEHGAYINQHLTCIRLDQNVLNPLYVAYYMESEAGKSQFESKNQSAVKAGLNFNSINSLRVMVPPLELQKSFVRFVEQTDKSKSTIQQSLEKLETLKKALMQKYFG